MNKLLSYSGIITKAKAMEANFISKNDYQKIANFETVAEFIGFLKNHPGYSNIFTGLDEHEIHRGQAEDIFINGLFLDFAKIYRFATIPQRNDLDLIFFRYEVTILKDCIQLVYNKKDSYDLSLFSSFFNSHSKIDVKTLAASHTMEEYINNLKNTQYHSTFVMLQSTNRLTSFDYEMQLDIYYFSKMWKLKDKQLQGDDLKAMTHSLGTEIDLLNIMWLYRSKKFYDIHSSDSYGFIIPVNYKLTKEQLATLMIAITIDEFLAILKHTYYEKMIPSLLDGTMEIFSQRIMSKVNQDNKSDYPFSMAPINNYLFQKLTEVGRLTTALECIRYKLEPQDTLRYVLQ